MREVTLLLVDDEKAIITLFARRLEKLFPNVSAATSGEEALEILQHQQIDVLVTDLNMPGINGCELITRAMKIQPMLQSIVVTGYSDNKTAIEAMAAGASSYLQKPLDSSELTIAIDKCLEKRHLIQEVQNKQKQLTEYRDHLEELVSKRTLELTKTNTKLQAEIEERKCLEASLRNATAQAENANRAKSEFLANMSHEIRTPMTSAIGLLNIVLNTKLLPKQKKYLDMARLSTLAMHNLLNDILDFSKIEAGRLNLEHIVFNPVDIIASVIELQHFHAQEKSIKLSTFISNEVPDALIGDSNRLRQIILNLVSNAIKFTQYGEVSVECIVASSEPPDSLALDQKYVTLQFSVQDSGTGIDQDKIESVLDVFSGKDSSTIRKSGGVGLGLNICSKLVTRMGGRIWVDSVPEQGCKFYFTSRFGVKPIEEEMEPKGKETGLSTMTTASQRNEALAILVAEDDKLVQMVIREILEGVGYKVFIVSNGITALKEIETQSFDIVLLDLNIPGMKGREVAQQIRKRERDTGIKKEESLPLIALTGDTDETVQKQCKEIGMDDFLNKPFDRDRLLSMIRAHLRLKSRLRVKVSEPVAPKVSPLEGEIFSKNTALKNASGDQEIMLARIKRFLQQVPQAVGLLRKAIVDENSLLLEQEVQKLKRMAIETGAINVADELFSLLMKLRNKQEVKNTEKLVDSLEAEFNSFKKVVEELM